MRAAVASPNPCGALTDVAGVLVGHDQRVGHGWLTGCTVVVPPGGTIGGVDVRGGGPATAETDALRPGTVTRRVDAVLLTGGSAYGLPAAAGVQRWCRDVERGFRVGEADTDVVPIVPALALFDLGRGGTPDACPDAAMAARAAASATAGTVATGNVGAGTGALLARGSMSGGTGTASVRLPGGLVVAALAVVNAAGTPLDPVTGTLLGASAVEDPALRPRVPDAREHDAAGLRLAAAAKLAPPRNTTLGVVATNAALDQAQTTRLAVAAQSGLARCLHPVHTLADGDVVVSLATGAADAAEAASPLPGPSWPGARAMAGELALGAAAATAMALAVVDAVLSASAVRTPVVDVPAYRDLYPSAMPPAWAPNPPPSS